MVPYTELKVWVVNATPRAMVKIATRERVGVLISMRKPNRRSASKVAIISTSISRPDHRSSVLFLN